MDRCVVPAIPVKLGTARAGAETGAASLLFDSRRSSTYFQMFIHFYFGSDAAINALNDLRETPLLVALRQRNYGAARILFSRTGFLFAHFV